MNTLPDGSWKTPPVVQVSAVCLRNTPKRVTKKGFLTNKEFIFQNDESPWRMPEAQLESEVYT
jgi:hypothetical protein